MVSLSFNKVLNSVTNTLTSQSKDQHIFPIIFTFVHLYFQLALLLKVICSFTTKLYTFNNYLIDHHRCFSCIINIPLILYHNLNVIN